MRASAISMVFTLLGTTTLTAQDWTTFSFDRHGHQCEGSVQTHTAKVKLPKMGDVYGAPKNPECGEPKESSFVFGPTFVDKDGDGDEELSFNLDVSLGDPKARCKNLIVRIPPTVHLCTLRFFKSESTGKGWEEVKSRRNKPDSRDFEWARKGTTRARVLADGTLEVKVEVKNWRRSYARYFGFVYDTQKSEGRVR